MKRSLQLCGIVVFLILLLVIASGAAAEETAEVSAAEGSDPAPSDLLGEAYNPFYTVEFPDGYTILYVSYEQQEALYSMYLEASDTAENVVAQMAQLLGCDDPDSVSMAAEMLNGHRVVSLETVNLLTGENTRCEINDFDEDGTYSVTLSQVISDSEAMDAFITANTNLEALEDIDAWFDLSLATEVTFYLYVSDSIAAMHYTFSFENAEEVKAELIAAFADDYVKNGDQIQLRYGDIDVTVSFEAIDYGEIYIEEKMETLDVCLGSYIPATTLENFGFTFWDEERNADYHDDANGVYMRIDKIEWAEEDSEDAVNSIVLSLSDGEDGYWIAYYPDLNSYDVSLQYGENFLEYLCVCAGDMMYFIIQNDLDDTDRTMSAIFPDAAVPLQGPIDIFEQFMMDTFGLTADELFAVDYQ